MFDIEYKGGNAVVIASKKTSLVVDPKVSLFGLKDLKVRDLVEFVTESRFATGRNDAQVIINSPGEYEVGDFTIIGIAATRHIDTPDDEKRSTIYRVECGEVSLGIIGNIAPGLSDEQLESLGVMQQALFQLSEQSTRRSLYQFIIVMLLFSMKSRKMKLKRLLKSWVLQSRM